MLFNGKHLQVDKHGDYLHLIFNNQEGSSNVINAAVISELPNALKAIKSDNSAKALIIRSEKDHFIFGADITEFLGHFKKPASEMEKWLLEVHTMFNEIEDLEMPTVTCLNGLALGGGCEVALTTDFRVAVPKAKIGLPETQLGILPGWGGTVRLPRMVGADNAIEWITSGKHNRASDALKIGAVDAVVEPDQLLNAANTLIERALTGKVDYKARRQRKLQPLDLTKVEATMAFSTAKGFVAGKAGPNYPAPVKAITVMEQACGLNRAEAASLEIKAFAELTKTPTAANLVAVFLGDQYVKKVSKKWTKNTENIQRGAVLGAGIMGGGIAYQSASRGIPVIMKDINHDAIELGLTEATKLLGKQLERGKIKPADMAKTLNMIQPSLTYGEFDTVNVVVEAIVENVKVKKAVLPEVEKQLGPKAVLASNTSTISITDLATSLQRPENFCGMHFFNPVHRMPLVEVIRGKKTSDEAVAATVQYSLQMGKTPIVVNDCPGFLVNRVLFPYFNGFNLLIEDGVDYKRIDKVMEKFGWPMGPAYLMDVVGIDTGDHAASIMADAFPDRMQMPNKTIVQALHGEKRLGQKNGVGFYKYEVDKKGRPKKTVDPTVDAIIKTVVKGNKDVTDEEIIERMMLPMIFECARCLEEKIVETPQEVDMGLVLGLGFPPFRAGALKYADDVGLSKVVKLGQKYASLGALYNPTEGIKALASSGKSYYQI